MKSLAVFLVCLGIAIARGDPTPNKANQLENKNGHQAAKPTGGQETASSRTGDLQLSNMAAYQDNRMLSAQDQQAFSNQQSQLQNSQSLIQPQNSAFQTQGQQGSSAQQFFSQTQPQQFLSQVQGETQQFSNQGRSSTTASPIDAQMGILNLLQQTQQRMNPAALSLIQAHSKEQVNDFSAQQMYTGSSSRPDTQEQLYQDRRNAMDSMQDQFNERRFSDSARQQNQISGKGQQQSVDIRPVVGGFPQVYQQGRSAFDNREQPLVLPGVSQTSTSVVVQGLKNLPVLPGLVYSSGAVPSAHVVAYSRPWFQGGAYIKQHWQTPFARYVYSHIL